MLILHHFDSCPVCNSYLMSNLSQHIGLRSRKEKGVPLCVSPHALGVVSSWIKLLPHARRKYMLVPLVPSSIDNLCKIGVVVGAFKVCIGRSDGAVVS